MFSYRSECKARINRADKVNYPKELKAQLSLYDIVTSAERRQLIKAYKKYGDSYKRVDNLTNAIEEILDLFGYLVLERMKNELRQSTKTT